MTAVIDGSNAATSGLINSGTAKDTSTGATLYDFTGIPAGVKRITVMISGVSTSGTSAVILQIGSSGGFKTSGYLGSSGQISGTNATQTLAHTTGLGINAGSAATVVFHGTATISLLDSSTNTWAHSSVIGRSDAGATTMSGGSVALAAVLTSLRLTTVGGTDTFDAGSVNIFWE